MTWDVTSRIQVITQRITWHISSNLDDASKVLPYLAMHAQRQQQHSPMGGCGGHRVIIQSLSRALVGVAGDVVELFNVG